MITTLDTTSWSKELVTGNAAFIESPSSPTGTLYVVSNTRDLASVGGGFGFGFGGNFGNNYGPANGGFVVLESTAVPPAPGPGSSFITRASYNFPQPNNDFDPVLAIDPLALPNPVIHIIGTRSTPTGGTTSSTQLNDLIKFTYDTVTHALTGPFVLSTGARVRGAYDIAVLQDHNTVVAVSLAEPIIMNATITGVAFGGITALITATSVTANVVTVTAANTFVTGDTILFAGLTVSTFLNGQTVAVLTASPTQFTATFVRPNYPTTADTGTASPAGVLTLSTAQPSDQFSPGQWLLLNGLTNATWLNGQLIQVLTVDGVITALFLFPGVYPPTPDTGTATPVGDSLLTMELDTASVLVPGSGRIVASSPSRTGDSYDAVSLVTANSVAGGFGFAFGFDFGNAVGSEVELYYQTHPKNFTFADQIFKINVVFRQSVAGITATSLSAGGILTVTANNNFVPGTVVTFTGTQEDGVLFPTRPTLNGTSVVVLSATSTQFTASFIVPVSPVNVELASAANFSLLAGSTITNVGATVLTGGNLGLFPGTVVSGIAPPPSANFTPPATEHINDVLALQAHIDATTAWGFYLAQPAGTQENVLDGLTLTPGTYSSFVDGFGMDFGFFFGGPSGASTMTLHTGQTLTLNGAGTYIFQIGPDPGFGVNFGMQFGGSALNIEPGATIVLAGGATADNIIWVVNGNATIGSGVTMFGTVLALNDISLGGGTLDGRALSLSGAINITAAEAINTENTFTQPPYSNPADTGSATPATPIWDSVPTTITTFNARYSDNRLTVIADTSGNRYLSQTYWSQLNHPEGILGSVILGYKPAGGAWFFHPTLGTTLGGSVLQSTLSVDTALNVNLAYLLQPFDALPAPPSAVAWPFHIASVAIPTLAVTEVPGFYNNLNFTWLRGTKSLVDNSSLWEIVGEREISTQVVEARTIPLIAPFTLLPVHAADFIGDVSVVFTPSQIPLVQVLTENPTQGQYYVESSSGLYVFNVLDAGKTISITYNYVSAILPVYASFFNIPPVATVTPTSVTLWRDTTYYATDVSEITSFSVTSNIVTCICVNDFVGGEQLAIYGFQGFTNSFLNGHTLTVLTATPTQFTASFTHANYTFVPGFGFGNNFGFGFGGQDFGFAALLVHGPLILNTAGSSDPDLDPLIFIWTDNDPDLTNVTVTPQGNGSTATVNVNPLVGGGARQFNVGVAVEDTFPDGITPRHVALVPTSVQIVGNVVTFTVPNLLAPAEQVMPYSIAIAPPVAPTVLSTPGGFGFNFGNFFGGALYYFKITYVNAVGETTTSAETVFSTSLPNVPVVQSPAPAGDAVAYNVYIGTAPDNEQLQFNSAGQLLPTPIGTNWSLAPGGLLVGTNPPTTNKAFLEFLNDIALTLTTANITQFTAPLVHANLSATAIIGFVMPQFQFAITNIVVPQNIAPTISFPTPWNPANPGVANITATSVASNIVTVFALNNFVLNQNVLLNGLTTSTFLNGVALTVLSANATQFTAAFTHANYVSTPDTGTATPTDLYVFANVSRNTQITITPNYPVGDPWSAGTVYLLGANVELAGITYTSVQNNNVGNNPTSSPLFWEIAVFPVVYNGITEPDDNPTYQWSQVSGSTVTLLNGSTSPSLIFSTAGVNLNGEVLGFTLTVNDGINPAVTVNFTINVAPYTFNAFNQDTQQLSRSIFASSATITNVSIFNGIGVITGNNNFFAGQTVFFEGMTATFLNTGNFTVLPTGFGSSFGAGFGAGFPSPTAFMIADPSLPNYTAADTGTAFSAMPIAQRNTPQGWSPLDISILFNNLQSVKRTSVLDGSDRFILISPHSVLVFGVFPDTAPESVLLRKLFLPNGANILDAVHTEQDYTLVLDTLGNIWRYTTAPLINTDNPDTRIQISNLTSLSFANSDLANDVHILTTVSFNNQRVVVLSGEQGALLLQLNTQTLAVTGVMEFDVASNNLYGASKVQFVRWVNMDNLHSGRILLGSILNDSAQITSVSLGAGTFNSITVGPNAIAVTAANNFSVGDVVILSGLNATLTSQAFNGVPLTVINATATQFLASLDPVSVGLPTNTTYGPTADSGLAQSQNSGSTFETLIDLGANQIIGTFDKSKLRNQFVATGEIMFDPDDTYAGAPAPPNLLVPTTVVFGGQVNINLTWQQGRPDLINSYTVQYAVENPFADTVPLTAPYTVQLPAIDEFTADEGVFDTTTVAPLTRTASDVPFPDQYNVTDAGVYTFNAAQAGHGVVLTIRQAFQNLQIVNAGNVQSIFVPLAPGRTYFFRVQATGLDGTSGFSNVQQITI